MFLEKNRDRIKKEFDAFCREMPEASGAIVRQLENVGEDTALAVKYLYANMPLSDVGNYSFETFLDFAAHGVMLWEHSPFCREMPEEIFLNYVLYHRINEEEIRPCRTLFAKQLEACVRGLSMERAALEVNYWCAEEVTYQSTDARTAAALDVYERGYGRCGEESVFAINALRSVGIPARQVYAVRWAHCDDNHAWTEVWCSGQWHYLGSCEPEAVLDKGWFTNAASRAMMISSRWFDRQASREDVIGREGICLMLNQLGRYARTVRVTVQVKDLQGQAAEDVQVFAEVLNYSEFVPVAVLRTGKDGTVSFVTGFGSLHITAAAGGKYGECLIDTREAQNCCCILGKEPLKEQWLDLDIAAPADTAGPGIAVDAAEEEENNRRTLEAAKACRKKRDSFRPAWKSAFWGPREEDKNEYMNCLSAKDRMDADPDILKEHYEETLAYRDQFPDTLFFPYIWSPRAADEILSKWRRGILEYFSPAQREEFCREPRRIWDWIEANIAVKTQRERLSVYTVPLAVLKLKTAGEQSRKVLFVAIARTLGIPARLNDTDGAMEYWDGHVFCRAQRGREKTAFVRLTGEKDVSWNYFQNWSIARLEKTGYHSLQLQDLSFGDGDLTVPVEPGQYRVLTANRLPTGNIFARQYVFCVEREETHEVCLTLRRAELADMLDSHEIPDYMVKDLDGIDVSLADISRGGRKILCWLDVGKEPTEHILNELSKRRADFALCQDQLVFILRGARDLEDPTLAGCRSLLPDVKIFYDTFAKCTEMVARRMYVDPGKLPLLVVTEGSRNGIFAASGYSVGMADMLLRVLKS